MSKELWIAAEQSFIDKFLEENDRQPTKDEIVDGMKTFYGNYLGNLIDKNEEMKGK